MLVAALDAGSEQDARQFLIAILGQMGVSANGEPAFSQAGDRMWVGELEIDLSGVGTFDPDDAPTIAKYLIRETDGMSWQVVRAGTGELLYGWPPALWLTQRPVTGPLHPAIRSMLIRISPAESQHSS